MLPNGSIYFYFKLSKMKQLLTTRKDVLLPGMLLLIALAAISTSGDSGDFAITVLSCLAVITILVDGAVSQHTAGFKTRTTIAATLAIILLVTGYLLLNPPVFSRSLPLLFLLAYWFAQTGQQVIHRYWKPLLILGLLAIPDRALITPLLYPFLKLFGWDAMTFPTAHVSAYLTSLLGLPATVNHLDIIVEYATVTVWEGCDAVRNMDFLLRLSIMLMLTVPIKPSRRLITIVVAILLGFFVNTLRIALLVIIANYGDMADFDYWHEGDGSKIFNLIAIILFAVFAYFQVEQKHSPSRPAGDKTILNAGKTSS